MSPVKKAFSKSVKFSKIPITLSKKGLPSAATGSSEDSGKSSSFEDDYLETQSSATDADSIFGMSRLTPRTPPPKSILKSEMEGLERLLLELCE